MTSVIQWLKSWTGSGTNREVEAEDRAVEEGPNEDAAPEDQLMEEEESMPAQDSEVEGEMEDQNNESSAELIVKTEESRKRRRRQSKKMQESLAMEMDNKKEDSKENEDKKKERKGMKKRRKEENQKKREEKEKKMEDKEEERNREEKERRKQRKEAKKEMKRKEMERKKEEKEKMEEKNRNEEEAKKKEENMKEVKMKEKKEKEKKMEEGKEKKEKMQKEKEKEEKMKEAEEKKKRKMRRKEKEEKDEQERMKKEKEEQKEEERRKEDQKKKTKESKKMERVKQKEEEVKKVGRQLIPKGLRKKEEEASEQEGTKTKEEEATKEKKDEKSFVALKEHVWCHRARLSEDDEASTCFVCLKGKKEKGVGSMCKCNVDGCNVHFHEFCIEDDYNAASFSARNLKKVVEEMKKGGSTSGYQCPSHHCSDCWNAKKKTSAVAGSIVECSLCYRGFHKECRPAAAELTFKMKNGKKVELTTCHQHGQIKAISKSSRAKFCYRCMKKPTVTKELVVINPTDAPPNKKAKTDNPTAETPSQKVVIHQEQMKECMGCLQIFHDKCFDKEVKGARETGTWCSTCVDGTTFSAGASVIHYYPRESAFYACSILSLDQILPKVKTYYTKSPHNFFGLPHKIPIAWAGVPNVQDFVDAHSLIHMFPGARQHFMMENAENFTEGWDELEKHNRRAVPDQTHMRKLERKAYTNIQARTFHLSSVYHKSVDVSTFRFEDLNECECVASKKNDVRCNNSSCYNLAMDMECPPSCWEGSRLGRCTNNEIQTKNNCKTVEIRLTKEKGHGMFATADIPKGTFISEYAGEIISSEEKSERMVSSTLRDNSEEHHYMMDIGNGLTVDCKHKGSNARFINHSCDPNCWARVKSIPIRVQKDKVMYDNRVGIYSTKEIKSGEELTFFYAMTAYEGGALPPQCFCGAPNCGKYLGKVSKKEAEDKSKKHDTKKKKKKTVLDKIRKNKKGKSKVVKSGKVGKENKMKAKKEIKKTKKDANNLRKILVAFKRKRATSVGLPDMRAATSN